MGYHHRTDPVYEEIEKPMSPRASVSDLSEDETGLYPHELDLYNRSLYGQQQVRTMGPGFLYFQSLPYLDWGWVLRPHVPEIIIS